MFHNGKVSRASYLGRHDEWEHCQGWRNSRSRASQAAHADSKLQRDVYIHIT